MANPFAALLSNQIPFRQDLPDAPVDQGVSPLGIPNAPPALQAPAGAPGDAAAIQSGASGAPWQGSYGVQEKDQDALAGLGPNGPSIFDRVSKQIAQQEKAGNVDDSPVNRLLASASAAPSSDSISSSSAAPMNLPSPHGYGKGLDDAALVGSMGVGNMDRFIANMAKAGSLGASALSGSHKDLGSGVSDSIMEHAGDQTKNLMLRRQGKDAETARDMSLYQLSSEAEKADPNSKISKMAQQLLKDQAAKAGISIGDPTGMSLQSLEKIFPTMERYFSQLDARASRKDAKTEADIMKYSKSMGEDLDPSRARSGVAGDVQKKVAAGQRLQQLAAQYPNLDLPPTMMQVFATDLATMLGSGAGGSTAYNQIAHLVPNTYSGSVANMMQWVTSNPHGAGQQKFVQQMLDTVQREEALAKNQLTEYDLKKAFTTHHQLKKLGPEGEEAFYHNLEMRTGLSRPEIQAFEKSGKLNVSENPVGGPPPGMILMKDPQGAPHYVPEKNKEAAMQKYGFVMP